MTRLAQLVAQMEGFGKPGATPTIRHNPGDLRHSPHSEHPGGPEHANDIGTIDTDADGWADLERQLQLRAAEHLTLQEFVFGRFDPACGVFADGYAPPGENDSQNYLNFLAAGLNLPCETQLSVCLQVPAVC
jgi:hypothetical protein